MGMITPPRELSALFEREGARQSSSFARLAAHYASRLRRLEVWDESRFVTEFWRVRFSRLKEELGDLPPYDFLNSPVIANTMMGHLQEGQISEILARLSMPSSGDRLKNLLLDDPAGRPPGLVPGFSCSQNHLHHANDLLYFLDRTKTDWREIKTVVEWGGGYGAMAKIVRRSNPDHSTYVLIDSNLMSCVQWLYLATIFGESEIHQILSHEEQIQAGRINLLPVSLLESQSRIECDFFISTFALNESSVYAQKYAIDRNWFDAKHLMLSYDLENFNLTSEMAQALERSGSIIEKTSAQDSSHYAFR